MSDTTVSRGKAFTVYFTQPTELISRMKRAPELAAAAMQAGADYWHSKILPLHFQKSAHARYGYAQRTKVYLKQWRKTGKPDMVYSGVMRQQLLSRYAFKYTRGSGGALTMTARALNFVPRMNNDDPSLYVKHSNTTNAGYPNMKREIKLVTEQEHEEITRIVTETLRNSFDVSKSEGPGSYSKII